MSEEVPRFEVAGGQEMEAVPEGMQQALEQATTVEEACEAILEHEAEVAQMLGRHEYIDCDQAATLLSDWLAWQGIAHVSCLGESRYGDVHVWIRIDGEDIDVTDQGTSEEYDVIERYEPEATA